MVGGYFWGENFGPKNFGPKNFGSNYLILKKFGSKNAWVGEKNFKVPAAF